MRAIRALLGGLALTLATGCVSVQISRTTSCNFDAPTPTPSVANAPADPSCEKVAIEGCCPVPKCWSIACVLQGPTFTRSCNSHESCFSRVCKFLTYRPLCSKVPPGCCADSDCTPPLYWYFETSNYNKPLTPICCEKKSWHRNMACWWKPWSKCSTDCGESNCKPGVCLPRLPLIQRPACLPATSGCTPSHGVGPTTQEPPPLAPAPDLPMPKQTPAPAKQISHQTPAAPTQVIRQSPVISPTPIMDGPVIMAPSEPTFRPVSPRLVERGSLGCANGACSSSSCGGGIAPCMKPKPRLDGLPILPPTMFRKYEPCNEYEGVPVMAPVPGTAVPMERIQMAPK